MCLEDAVLCILQAAEAVAEMHDHGIVCRELGPRNLLLTRRAGAPLVKILDLGTAKLARASTADDEATRLRRVYYSSPELARRAGDATPADVWSLAACLYYRVGVGRSPADSAVADAPDRGAIPASRRAPASSRLVAVFSWAMAKDVGRAADVSALGAWPFAGGAWSLVGGSPARRRALGLEAPPRALGRRRRRRGERSRPPSRERLRPAPEARSCRRSPHH
jgi:serine/threonine-protein kinase